jgi:hypothetical protein
MRQAMLASRDYSGYNQNVPRQMTGVHVTAYFGLGNMRMALLDNRLDPDFKNNYGRTPLFVGNI